MVRDKAMNRKPNKVPAPLSGVTTHNVKTVNYRRTSDAGADRAGLAAFP